MGLGRVVDVCGACAFVGLVEVVWVDGHRYPLFLSLWIAWT